MALKVLLVILAVVLLVLIGFGIWDKFIKKPTPAQLAVKQASAEEKAYDPGIDKQLAAGNVTGYEISKLQQAATYLKLNDYGNAQQVLDTIAANVPKNKLQETYYLDLLRIAKYQQNKNAQKQVLTDLIALLKSEKNPTYVAYQQQLEKL